MLHLHHSSFRKPSFASPTLQALHIIHLASRPWVLRSDLKLFPYIITLLHKLADQNKRRRLEYALWAEGKDEIFVKTWFSDEDYFHFNGTVNKQNVRFWGREKSQNVHERTTHGEKVSVW